MDPMEAERILRKLDRRLEQVEQILPTLPTREEMKQVIAEAVEPLASRKEMTKAIAEAVAPLATKDELAAALAPLATKDELYEEGARTRQHFDVVAEGLRDDIRLLAEHQVAFQAEVKRGFKEVGKRLDNHERRITHLETGERRRRVRR